MGRTRITGLAIAGVIATAAPASAQVALRPEALPDLENLVLIAPEMECEWRPGVQLGRVELVAHDDSADIEVALGVRPSRSSRLAISAATGATADHHPAYGALAMTGTLGLGPSVGRGVDLAVRGALERSAVDYRPAPMPMRAPGSHALRAIDGELWLTSRHGDHGWAVMPVGYGIEDIEHGLAGKPLGTAAIDRTRNQRLAAAIGLRAYESSIADSTVAARVELGRTELTGDATRDVVDHLAAMITLDGAATSLRPLPIPLLPKQVLATALALDLGLGVAALRHTTRGDPGVGERDTIFVGTAGMVATSRGGTVAGAGVSVGPGHTPDGAHLARLWRVEGRYGTCVGPVCGEARAAMSWLEPLRAPDVPTTAEHQVTGRLTYAVYRTIRVGIDYHASHRGAWDAAWSHAVGAVLELGSTYGGANPHSVPHGDATITVCN